jgi:folate-binding protein YgfZ
MGIDAPQPGHWSEWRTWVVAALTSTGQPGYRFFVPAAEHGNVIVWITGAGAIQAGREEWNTVRIENGFPRYGEDITERQIPHDTGLLDRAVSFNKGCYLGQEIVERVRSRGHAGRKLVQLIIPGQTPPPVQTKLLLEEHDSGEITSAAYSPDRECVYALAYVRAKTFLPGATYSFEGGTATPVTEQRSL